MRMITAAESISLDGVTRAPGRPDEDERGGCTRDHEQGRIMGELVRALLGRQLLDELLLLVHPVLLGAGQRLFDDGSPATLRLQDVAPTGVGALITRCTVEGVR